MKKKKQKMNKRNKEARKKIRKNPEKILCNKNDRYITMIY